MISNASPPRLQPCSATDTRSYLGYARGQERGFKSCFWPVGMVPHLPSHPRISNRACGVPLTRTIADAEALTILMQVTSKQCVRHSRVDAKDDEGGSAHEAAAAGAMIKKRTSTSSGAPRNRGNRRDLPLQRTAIRARQRCYQV